MVSYVITGASRGLGFEMVKQFSADPKNVIVGLVRNKEAAVQKVAQELNRPNIHMVQADMTDPKSIRNAAAEASVVLGGSLDHLFASAGILGEWSGFDTLENLGMKDPERLTQDFLDTYSVNVIGPVHVINAFLPLIRKGTAKKIVVLTSGHADTALPIKYGVHEAAPYSISKAALNMVVAKYAATCSAEGITVLALSPGYVATSVNVNIPEEAQAAAAAMGAKFHAYAPHFTGPMSPEDSVSAMKSVVDQANIADGYSGAFVSHRGLGMPWL